MGSPSQRGVAQVGVRVVPPLRPSAGVGRPTNSLHEGNRFCSYRVYAALPPSVAVVDVVVVAHLYILARSLARSGPTELLQPVMRSCSFAFFFVPLYRPSPYTFNMLRWQLPPTPRTLPNSQMVTQQNSYFPYHFLCVLVLQLSFSHHKGGRT